MTNEEIQSAISITCSEINKAAMLESPAHLVNALNNHLDFLLEIQSQRVLPPVKFKPGSLTASETIIKEMNNANK